MSEAGKLVNYPGLVKLWILEEIHWHYFTRPVRQRIIDTQGLLKENKLFSPRDEPLTG